MQSLCRTVWFHIDEVTGVEDQKSRGVLIGDHHLILIRSTLLAASKP